MGDENLAISVGEGCQQALGGRFRVRYGSDLSACAPLASWQRVKLEQARAGTHMPE
jgi:hypothetical protein